MHDMKTVNVQVQYNFQLELLYIDKHILNHITLID